MTNIAVDWDGTLVRTTDLVCSFINYKHGTSYTAKDVKSWNFWQDQGLGDSFWGVFDILDAADLRLALKPYDANTIPVLRHLARTHNVDIVTANKPSAEPAIRGWLKYHLPTLHRKIDIVTIGRGGGPPVKGDPKLALDYEVYLDDAPKIVEMLPQHPGKTILLANAPWNRDVQTGPNVRRFHRWSELPALVGAIVAKKPLEDFPEVRS